jgi:hypothetical protein
VSQRDSIAKPFTTRQRRGLIAFCVLMLAISVLSLVQRRSLVPDPLPAEGVRAAELQDWLDPNTASIEEFAALPALGERRAMEIVEFRERASRRDPLVFRKPQDLMQVRGIGAAIVEQIRPFLRFPGIPTTSPAD